MFAEFVQKAVILISTLFAVNAALAVESATKPPASENCATLETTEGKVELIRTGSRENKVVDADTGVGRFVMAPQLLNCSDVIITSRLSRAKIKFGQATLILGPETRITIGGAEGLKQVTKANLFFGKLRAHFQKNETSAQTFQVRVKTATVGVRGTDFFLDYNPATDGLNESTLDGLVTVSKNEGKTAVEVSAGHMIVVKGSDPNNSDLQYMKPSNIDQQTAKEIQSVSGELANDKGFHTSSADTVFATALNSPVTQSHEEKSVPTPDFQSRISPEPPVSGTPEFQAAPRAARADSPYTTSKGAVFTPVQGSKGFGQGWKDPSGKIWSMNQGYYANNAIKPDHNGVVVESPATEACAKIGGRLPTAEQYQNFISSYFGVDGHGYLTDQGRKDLYAVFPDMHGLSFWSSWGGGSDLGYVFDAYAGNAYIYLARNNKESVRCIQTK